MRKVFVIAAAVLALASCNPDRGKVAIVAHRGFWNCEAAGFTENSIASLKAAQDNGFWGSEFDVHLTADNEVVVNHDPKIQGIRIKGATLDSLKQLTLKNGEHPSSLDEYLTQGEKCSTTMLVLEMKDTHDTLRCETLVQKCLAALKAHDLYKPERVMFISFCPYICDRIAQLAPEFTNQYLSSDTAPAQLLERGINGIDYHGGSLREHPEWIAEANELGMSVNVWTINKAEEMSEFIEAGVGAITTNEPLTTRQLLGKKELRIKAK